MGIGRGEPRKASLLLLPCSVRHGLLYLANGNKIGGGYDWREVTRLTLGILTSMGRMDDGVVVWWRVDGCEPASVPAAANYCCQASHSAML